MSHGRDEPAVRDLGRRRARRACTRRRCGSTTGIGLVSPTRTAGKSRRYSMRDVVQLREIAQLSSEGVSLEGIRRVLGLEDEVSTLRDRVRELESMLADEMLNRPGSPRLRRRLGGRHRVAPRRHARAPRERRRRVAPARARRRLSACRGGASAPPGRGRRLDHLVGARAPVGAVAVVARGPRRGPDRLRRRIRGVASGERGVDVGVAARLQVLRRVERGLDEGRVAAEPAIRRPSPARCSAGCCGSTSCRRRSPAASTAS